MIREEEEEKFKLSLKESKCNEQLFINCTRVDLRHSVKQPLQLFPVEIYRVDVTFAREGIDFDSIESLRFDNWSRI